MEEKASEAKEPSSFLFWAKVAGAVLLLVLVLDLLEGIVPGAEGASLEIGIDRLRPKVTMESDRRIQIRYGLMKQSGYPFHEDKPAAEIEAIFECLKQGIVEIFGEPAGPDEKVMVSAEEFRERQQFSEDAMAAIRDRCIPRDWHGEPEHAND